MNELYIIVYRKPYKSPMEVAFYKTYESEQNALYHLKDNIVQTGDAHSRAKARQQSELHAIYKIDLANGKTTALEMHMSDQFVLTLKEKVEKKDEQQQN